MSNEDRAAEYVLGSLYGLARKRFEGLLAREPRLLLHRIQAQERRYRILTQRDVAL